MVSAPPTPFVPVSAIGASVPAVVLRDQRGRPFATGDLRGAATAIAFVYTRCRDADGCALVSAKFARLQAITSARELRLVEVTLDPAYDTSAVLARYGAGFRANPARWTLATGAPADVFAFERRLGVDAVAKPDGELEHEDIVVLLDPRGRIADRIDGAGWTPGQVSAEARGLDGLSSNVPARLLLALTRGVSGFCGGTSAGIANWAILAVLAASLGGFGYAFRKLVRLPA